MQQIESNLPQNVTTRFFIINSAGVDAIEIAVQIDDDYVDLDFPRLCGTYKIVNGTWSTKFTLDFFLLKNETGDPIFEAETIAINRNQFKTKKAMLNRLEQFYCEY